MAHILIVDDDEIVAELTSGVLIAEGHACGWVTNTKDAERLLNWRRPDIMLLDINMPEENGTSLLRRVRQSPQLYDLPVIMFTAATSDADEHRSLYNGAHGYLRKPVKPKTLIWQINEMLNNREDRPKHRSLDELAASEWNEKDEEKPRRAFL